MKLRSLLPAAVIVAFLTLLLPCEAQRFEVQPLRERVLVSQQRARSLVAAHLSRKTPLAQRSRHGIRAIEVGRRLTQAVSGAAHETSRPAPGHERPRDERLARRAIPLRALQQRKCLRLACVFDQDFGRQHGEAPLPVGILRLPRAAQPFPGLGLGGREQALANVLVTGAKQLFHRWRSHARDRSQEQQRCPKPHLGRPSPSTDAKAISPDGGELSSARSSVRRRASALMKNSPR